MKIIEDDYNNLQTACNVVLVKHPDVKINYQNAGLSEERLRWDVLHASGFNVTSLYTYLNDNHIDAALKRIVKEFYGKDYERGE